MSTAEAAAVIEVAGLAKRFDRTVALDDVSLIVPRGSIFGLLGPNGAGKTTLFSIVAGFLRADAGSVRVLGHDLSELSALQGRVTILPQDALFQSNVPILEQLVFLRRLDGSDPATARAEVAATLERVGLAEYAQRGVHALSHGMIKRLGLAQAFLGEPELILLDEPTSGLDPQNASQIRGLITELQRSGQATTVVSSHNLLEIQELCDHVAILDEGSLITAGPTEAILRENRQVELRLSRELAPDEIARLAAVPGVGTVDGPAPPRYVVRLALGDSDDVDGATARLLRALLDLGVSPRRLSQGSSLEEFFLRVTGK